MLFHKLNQKVNISSSEICLHRYRRRILCGIKTNFWQFGSNCYEELFWNCYEELTRLLLQPTSSCSLRNSRYLLNTIQLHSSPWSSILYTWNIVNQFNWLIAFLSQRLPLGWSQYQLSRNCVQYQINLITGKNLYLFYSVLVLRASMAGVRNITYSYTSPDI